MKIITGEYNGVLVQSYFIKNQILYCATSKSDYGSDYWSFRTKNFEITIDFFPLKGWRWCFFYGKPHSKCIMLVLPSLVLKLRTK